MYYVQQVLDFNLTGPVWECICTDPVNNALFRVLFIGPRARDRSIEYAAWKNKEH